MSTVNLGDDSSGTSSTRSPFSSWYSLTPSTLASATGGLPAGVATASARAGLASVTAGDLGVVGAAAMSGPDLQAASAARATNRVRFMLSSHLLVDAELGVDHFLELLDRDGAEQRPPVDEEGRRTGDPHLLARLLRGGDVLGLGVGVEALLEARRVEPDRLGVALEVRDLERALVVEHFLVHFPVLALVERAQRRLGRLLGVLVHLERELAVDEAHLALVGLHDLADDRLDLAAE